MGIFNQQPNYNQSFTIGKRGPPGPPGPPGATGARALVLNSQQMGIMIW